MDIGGEECPQCVRPLVSGRDDAGIPPAIQTANESCEELLGSSELRLRDDEKNAFFIDFWLHFLYNST